MESGAGAGSGTTRGEVWSSPFPTRTNKLLIEPLLYAERLSARILDQVRIPAPPLSIPVTLEKLLNLSGPVSPTVKWLITRVSTSQGVYGFWSALVFVIAVRLTLEWAQSLCQILFKGSWN